MGFHSKVVLRIKVLGFLKDRIGFFGIRFNGCHGIGSAVWVFRIWMFLRLRSTLLDKDVFYQPAYI